MKSILISKLKNAWAITDVTESGITFESSEQTEVFTTISQLQEALAGLLAQPEDRPMPGLTQEYLDAQAKKLGVHKLTTEECLESHKKAVEEFEAKGNAQRVTPKAETHDD